MLIQVQDGSYWPKLKVAGAVFLAMGVLNGGWQLSIGTREISETTESLSPSRLSAQHSSSPTCSAGAHPSSKANGIQNDSRSETELRRQYPGVCGRPQASFEGSVGSIRFRRLFSCDRV